MEMHDIIAKSTDLDALYTNNPQEFIEFFRDDNYSTFIEIDNEISSINVAIHLRGIKNYIASLVIAKKTLESYKESYLALYECALSSAYLLDFEGATEFTFKALSIQPHSFDALLLLIRVSALNGEYENARNAFDNFSFIAEENYALAQEAIQFNEYCRDWNFKDLVKTVGHIENSERFLVTDSVSLELLKAVSDKRPYSLVRLGDGEGAWISLGIYDETKFSQLYNSNRRSFLKDWFGTEKLINDSSFSRFAKNLQADLTTHDIVGIPTVARLEQEASYLSMRGIPSSVNALRLLDVLKSNSGPLLCTNSINLTLSEHGFYRKLFSQLDRISLITSQRDVPAMFTSINISITDLYLVPGDSRNFYRLENIGEPDCQFPDHLLRINSELESRDHYGKVFLVAAGYVGKKYIKTIRDRGGIAIDIGSIADYWAKIGYIE